MQIHALAFMLIVSSFFACQEVSENGPAYTANLTSQSICTGWQDPDHAPAGAAANIIFQSTDNGQTWQDISEGLPADLKLEEFFTAAAGLYLRTDKAVYHSSTAAAVPDWQREVSLNDPGAAVFPGRAGLFACNSEGHFFQKIKGARVWLPLFPNFENHSVRTIFETSDGTVFIGCDNGIFKSADYGKSWKHVFEDGWVIKMVESDGVLLCTNEHGILRSADGGEHWNLVVKEGGVGITVERIEGGFAAITYNTTSETRRVRISTDGGKTWQAIDAGLPPHASIASIKQVGEYFFCGHPDGVFRSSDKGKTWKLILPAIGEKVFNLSISGNVIYAVPRDGGC